MTSADASLLEKFIADCREAARGSGAVARIAELTEALVADPSAIQAEAKPLPDRIPSMGWEDLLFDDDAITVMLIATPPGVAQPPHDHRMPAVIGVFQGCEDQRFYRRQGDGLLEMRGRAIQQGEVLTLGKATVHAISTDGPDVCRAVHVYLGKLADVDRTIYDPETFEPEVFTIERYAEYCIPL
ncbi:MAG: hypothetical protein HKN03_04340 [Acidimicrobiales bacterium]|nr:hypothetical protein [Acidimicrobiales bacterium]